ncbi:cell wall protein [Colletotrichum tabaci]|uniref:Cell wall protein n=1 Tax=Colletotrichum tabaci TaxID=1209068 RepID=A0AAV9T8A5_9PEZI
MRAFLVLSSLVLNVALAAPPSEISKRDLVTIQGALVTVSTAASNLDVAVRALNSDPKTAGALVPAVMDIEFALTQARTDILPTQPLSIGDAITLQNAADTLTKSFKIMVMSSMLQRQALDQLGMTPMLLMSFMNQNMLTAALSQAVVSKVPAEGISNTVFAFGGGGGAVNMGILSLSNPPLAMPANMTPPAPAPPAAPQQPAPPPAPENPQQPPPQQPPPPAAGATATGQGQGQAAPQENPASSAITADTNKTAS